MAEKELYFKSAAELGSLIRDKELSPVEVVEAHLKRIEELEPRLNSFITLLPDQALESARKAEKEIQGGKYKGLLHGVPLGMKDAYKTKDIRTTYGCKVYDRYVPDEDSTTVERLRQAGAILIGKLNLHTLEYGSTGQNNYYGDMHNPWDTTRYSGGSSGGSASAVVTGECSIAMGSDTGGSIRMPAGLCGLVGLKTTFGRLSRHGLMELSPTMDHHGPMTKTVEDCALVLNAIVGHDPKDTKSSTVPTLDYTRSLTGDIKGLRIGVPKEFFEVPVASEIKQAVEDAINVLSDLGAVVTEVSWPAFHNAYAISTIILGADAGQSLRSLVLNHGLDIEPIVRNRVEAGFFIPVTRYIQAQRARSILDRQSYDLLKQVDILAGPTLSVTAPTIGQTETTVAGTRMHVGEALTRYTRAYNLNGLPAISVPCGFSSKKLPVGFQLAGRAFEEETVLRVAYAYEQATQWHKVRPPL